MGSQANLFKQWRFCGTPSLVLDREYNLHAPTCLFSSFLVQVFIEYILKANKLILAETLVSVVNMQ